MFLTSRVFIFEPGLVNERGHHASAAAHFATMIGADRVVVVSNRQWNGPLELAGCPVVRHFKRDRQAVSRLRRYGFAMAQGVFFADKLIAPRRRQRAIADPADVSTASANASELRSLTAKDYLDCLGGLGVGGADRVFIPSADAETILAIAEVFNERRNLPQIFLRLMYDDPGNHRTDPTWRSAIDVLARDPGAKERVTFMTETKAFAGAIEQRWDAPVTLLPHPSDLSFAPPPPFAGPMTVFVPGQARNDKGLHLLAQLRDALEAAVAGSAHRMRFVVQGVPLNDSPHVSFETLPDHLKAADYQRHWGDCHATLLLHLPSIYRLRGSGAVCDAVASGRPFVCLQGTSLAEWTSSGNAIAAPADARPIANALISIAQNYAGFGAASAQLVQDYQDKLRQGVADLRTV